MSIDTTSTINSLNEAFIQETTTTAVTAVAAVAGTTGTGTGTGTGTAASARPYEYCQCYGTFVAEMDKFDIDVLVSLAQDIHRTTEAIIPQEHCWCAVCFGFIRQCSECDGLYMAKQEDEIDEDKTAEYDEYEEEELRGSPIEFLDEAEDDHIDSPTTKKLFMDLEEIEESMAQVVLSSEHAR
jgi:hypothetical protein